MAVWYFKLLYQHIAGEKNKFHHKKDIIAFIYYYHRTVYIIFITVHFIKANSSQKCKINSILIMEVFISNSLRVH